MLEVTFPTEAAAAGTALIFSWEMPEAEAQDAAAEAEALAPLLSPAPAAPAADGAAAAPPSAPAAPPAAMRSVRQLRMRAPECREDFGPITPQSPVRQYSRAYLYHLHEVHELLGTMLLVHHNLYVYREFFAAIRRHTSQGSLRRFAAWFMRTQTCEPEAVVEAVAAASAKRPRKA
mmetsp:Transcript_104101/g.333780  ORF Transcript_104101/g.333780 Transcript_104101/m.333780 type:complete len:176 (+) Transcript_104101:1055-1582(+)